MSFLPFTLPQVGNTPYLKGVTVEIMFERASPILLNSRADPLADISSHVICKSVKALQKVQIGLHTYVRHLQKLPPVNPIDSNLVAWYHQETSEEIFNPSLERTLNHDPDHTHSSTGWWAPNLDPPLPLEAHSPKTPGPRPLMNHQATPRGPTKDKSNCRRLPLILFSRSI